MKSAFVGSKLVCVFILFGCKSTKTILRGMADIFDWRKLSVYSTILLRIFVPRDQLRAHIEFSNKGVCSSRVE